MKTRSPSRPRAQMTATRYRWKRGWLCVLNERDEAVCWTSTPEDAQMICRALNRRQET